MVRLFPDYFMSRYSTDMLYTFEFIICVFMFILLALLARYKGEKNSLFVFILTGLLHSVIELVAEGTGVRVISETYLFGKLFISYPFLPFILGFYEGGIFCLMAYHFVRILINKDRFSLKFFLIFGIGFLVLITLGAFRMQSGSIIFTRRQIFSLGNLILLLICYTIAIGYFTLKKNISSRVRKSFLLFYLGLILITALMVIPLHIGGIRFIEVYEGGSYYYASILEQILVLYGYSLVFEAAGFFLPFYVLIYHFKLIEIQDK